MCAREILFLRTTLGTGLARTGYRCRILFLNVPQQGHNIRHKCTLQRLILALRAAWGTAVRMEPTNHLGHSCNKYPDVDACNIGGGGRRYSGDVKVVCPLQQQRGARTTVGRALLSLSATPRLSTGTWSWGMGPTARRERVVCIARLAGGGARKRGTS